MAGPLGVICGLLVWSFHVGLILLLAYCIYFVLVALPRIRAMRRHSLELLCDTEWARSKGYTADRLKLMTSPWAR